MQSKRRVAGNTPPFESMATSKPDNAFFCCSLKMVERGFGKMREARLTVSCDMISYLTLLREAAELQAPQFASRAEDDIF